MNLRPLGLGLDGVAPTLGIARDFDLPGANVFGLYLEMRHSAPQCAQNSMKRAKYLVKVWFLPFEAGKFPGIVPSCNLNG